MTSKGRPPIPPEKRRSTLVRVLVTEAEHEELQRAAADIGCSVSTFLRGPALVKARQGRTAPLPPMAKCFSCDGSGTVEAYDCSVCDDKIYVETDGDPITMSCGHRRHAPGWGCKGPCRACPPIAPSAVVP